MKKGELLLDSVVVAAVGLFLIGVARWGLGLFYAPSPLVGDILDVVVALGAIGVGVNFYREGEPLHLFDGENVDDKPFYWDRIPGLEGDDDADDVVEEAAGEPSENKLVPVPSSDQPLDFGGSDEGATASAASTSATATTTAATATAVSTATMVENAQQGVALEQQVQVVNDELPPEWGEASPFDDAPPPDDFFPPYDDYGDEVARTPEEQRELDEAFWASVEAGEG